MNQPEWIDNLADLIRSQWKYHGPCQQVSIQSAYDDRHYAWTIEVAPVFQVIYGGPDDGKTVWTAFTFDAGSLGRLPGVFIEDFAVASYCRECSPQPRLLIRGKYQGHRFLLNVCLEPIQGAQAVEVIDTISLSIKTSDGTNSLASRRCRGTASMPYVGEAETILPAGAK